MTRPERIAALKKALEQRVLVVDGAMGTAIQALDLNAADFGGPQYEGCNEYLVLSKPELIERIHRDYVEAGADILETNSFGGTPLVLAEYGLAERAREINRAAALLARTVADQYSTEERPLFVAGAIGPTTKAISVTGGVSFEQLIEHFYVQAQALYEGGVDYFLLETCQDTRNVKAGLLAIERLHAETKERLPIAVSGTIEPMGTMLAGQSVEALATSLEHLDLLYLGLNCATGPEFMTDHIRSLAQLTRARVACVPNAGLPDENGRYPETPEMLARTLKRFGEQGWLNLVGGCCGTRKEHIAALARLAKGLKPRVPSPTRCSALSGVDYLEVSEEIRPAIVGERTNVIGSRKFKDLICAEKYDEASDIARAQVKQGAHLIDVCLANPDRDELSDMRRFLELLVKKIRVPLMIDSTDEKVIAAALTYSQGKAIINSVNLEDGEERFHKVVPLAKSFGAALVVGTIDDDKVQGMAVTRERKLAVAQREYDLLVDKYGMAPEDLYFDPLVFPCATGDRQYLGSAVETIEGVRLIKQRFPRCKTVLGISNISFGLPPAGREVLNAVFLYHCTQAGLDLALVNAEKLVRFPTIPAEERKLAEDLLWNRGADPVGAFAAYFREKKPEAKGPAKVLSLDERLARYIVEGSKDGLVEDLDEALKTRRPLELINGPLMKGMDEVGRLFNKNELIVAEVLQSAEAMKAAVSHLEKLMDKADTAVRGKVLLATVKGDVHDIGKNLVEIVLGNNGFDVVNLGIKVAPEQLVAAVREHQPHIIGLSGLLVKSAQQMAVTAGDLARAGIEVPMLVGGAALSRNFVDKQIAPAYGGTVAYASDAMSGLELAKRIRDPKQREQLEAEQRARRELPPGLTGILAAKPAAATVRSSAVQGALEIPQPSDFERHVLGNTPLDQVWKFVNPVMLYGRHLGLKGSIVRGMETAERAELERSEVGRKALELREQVEEVKAECRAGLMKIRAVYQFFRAGSQGNTLHLYEGQTEKRLASFELSRQAKVDGLCLADYLDPQGSPRGDNVCLFVVSAGEGIRERAEQLKKQGDYLKSHTLQALALESAEGYAEYLHSLIRSIWGFPDAPDTTMLDRFKASYRGKRYSFGYPACPRLEDQELLFKALRPEEIGVRLTDGCMMDPEASVSAIVFHHPEASYFSVLNLGEGGAT